MSKQSGKSFAIKTIRKSNLITNEEAKAVFENEIHILKQLDHPNILKIYEVYEDARSIHIVTEL